MTVQAPTIADDARVLAATQVRVMQHQGHRPESIRGWLLAGARGEAQHCVIMRHLDELREAEAAYRAEVERLTEGAL